MTLQERILSIAWSWKEKSCRETVRNGGSCIDDVHRQYGGAFRREAYCAKFCVVVIEQACREHGIASLLPHTAGALDLLQRSIKGGRLRVDEKPEPGAVFYRKSTVAGVSGHCGIVYHLGGNDGVTLVTVEGNTGNRIDAFQTPHSKVFDPRNGYRFIHTEDMDGSRPTSIVTPLLLASGSALVFNIAKSNRWI